MMPNIVLIDLDDVRLSASGAARQDDERKFIHVDMDSFFVSVELLQAPWLRDRPVAVGGNAAERGAISTASHPARPFGINSAKKPASFNVGRPNGG
ncbi:hypothetical protein [Pseudomonas asplenii]|uniref:Y-family DNA polymerase n=1 Tax=Pseudomonas asplenii TaxID=53407 RepID=UPI001F4C7938|nr:hypothetical protein [Pseudomonas fuscovaginae]